MDLDVSTAAMRDIVIEAWSRRGNFDLRGVGYGTAHWGKGAGISRPFPYYFFLAAMVNLTGSRHIVEVGTHQGGSAKALAAGLVNPAESRIVTFDVTAYGAKMLEDHAVIRAYAVDANSEAAYDICVRQFGTPKIDLAFIDSAHVFWETLSSFMLYGSVMRADFVILDDITLNPGMQKLWSIIQAEFADDAIDASEVVKEIRAATPENRPGFGVVRMNGRGLGQPAFSSRSASVIGR